MCQGPEAGADLDCSEISKAARWLESGKPGERGWRGIGGAVKSQIAMGIDLKFVLYEGRLGRQQFQGRDVI